MNLADRLMVWRRRRQQHRLDREERRAEAIDALNDTYRNERSRVLLGIPERKRRLRN
jgi:hypothetical protein